MKLKRKSIFVLIILIFCIGIYLLYNSFYYLFDRKLNSDINENLNTHLKSTLDENEVDILYKMSMNEKNPEKKKKIIEEIYNYMPDEEKYKLYYNLANTYYQNMDFLDCILNLDKAISFEPYCYKCYNLRGLAKKYLSNYDGALSDFTKGLDIKEDAELYFNRGLLYDLILKFKNSAIADYEAAMKIDIRYKDPKILLFDIYINANNIKEAKKILENMRQTLNSKNPENYALIQMHEAIILLLENNINSSINIMNNILNYLINLDRKSLNNSEYDFIYLKIVTIMYKLFALNKHELAEQYIYKLEKLEKKYNSERLSTEIYILQEKFKRNIK